MWDSVQPTGNVTGKPGVTGISFIISFILLHAGGIWDRFRTFLLLPFRPSLGTRSWLLGERNAPHLLAVSLHGGGLFGSDVHGLLNWAGHLQLSWFPVFSLFQMGRDRSVSPKERDKEVPLRKRLTIMSKQRAMGSFKQLVLRLQGKTQQFPVLLLLCLKGCKEC